MRQCILMAGSVLSATVSLGEKPNIVLFFADDLGWADVGFNGSTYHLTPNLDAFAAKAMVFSDAYAYPTCSPSRACLITGQNTPRHGIYRVEAYKPTPEPYRKILAAETGHFYEGPAPTIGEIMQRAGYVCGYSGKWHMGDRPGTLPQGRGFVMNAGGCGFGAPPSWFSPYKNEQLPDGPEGEYLPERLTQESIRFIRENKDRPFFLIQAPYLVHRPVRPKPEYVGLFRDRQPDEGRSNPEYAAMVYALDVEFGKLVQALKDEGVFENTLIVLFSDNGPNPLCAKGTPLRGWKASVHEGGIRVPMFAYWHGVSLSGVSSVPVTVMDMIPTFLEAAGSGTEGLVLDGESILPLLRGDGKLKRDALYWHHPCYTIPTVFAEGVRENYAYWGDGEFFLPSEEERGDWVRPCSMIRSGDYKLILECETGTMELYNLKDDIGETRNLAFEQLGKAAALKSKLGAWLDEMNAVIPSEPNPSYDPEFKTN